MRRGTSRDHRRLLEKEAEAIRVRGQREGWSRDRIVDEILRRCPQISALEAHRFASGWTRRILSEVLDQLHHEDGRRAPHISTAEICRWEHGRHVPGRQRQRYLARAYGTRPDRLGFAASPEVPSGAAAPPGEPAVAATAAVELAGPDRLRAASGVPSAMEATAELLELVRRLEAGDVGPASLDTIDRVVDLLCRAYANTPAGVLLPRVREHQQHVALLLQRRLRLEQHGRLLLAAGWLGVLRACLEFDRGARQAAQTSCDLALNLARQVGHDELLGWTFELRAWWAIVDQRFRDAVEVARLGQAEAVAPSSAVVQLAAQEAHALARLQEAEPARRALARAEGTLSRLPPPEHPEHHFVFDATKLSFYAAHCLVTLGEGREAEAQAREVIRRCADGRWTARMLEAHVDLALALLTLHRVDEAGHAGVQALSYAPLCTTALWRTGELEARLLAQHAGVPEVRDFRERLVAARLDAQGSRAAEPGDAPVGGVLAG